MARDITARAFCAGIYFASILTFGYAAWQDEGRDTAITTLSRRLRATETRLTALEAKDAAQRPKTAARPSAPSQRPAWKGLGCKATAYRTFDVPWRNGR